RTPMTRRALLVALLVAFVAVSAGGGDEKPAPKPEDMVRESVATLVKMQEDGGQWPYEGVYRVGGQLPVGYRVGGTAIVAKTLMYAAPEDKDAKAAVQKALGFVLKTLDDPLMVPSTKDAYDVRVWGHACALEFLCHVRAKKLAGDQAKDVDAWVK